METLTGGAHPGSITTGHTLRPSTYANKRLKLSLRTHEADVLVVDVDEPDNSKDSTSLCIGMKPGLHKAACKAMSME